MTELNKLITPDTKLVLFNKPYGVISQFSHAGLHSTLTDYISIKNIYPVGRLDTDSEGLLLLTNNGKLQAYLSNPKFNKWKIYFAQVEGNASLEQMAMLRNGVDLGDFVTKPARVNLVDEPEWLWERNPPIRKRVKIPTCWLKISITEGKNRQVRRMTAKVGLPTLRLIRYSIDKFLLENLTSGEFRLVKNFPKLPSN